MTNDTIDLRIAPEKLFKFCTFGPLLLCVRVWRTVGGGGQIPEAGGGWSRGGKGLSGSNTGSVWTALR